MSDQAAWEKGLATADGWYSGLPADIRAELDGLLDEIMQLKEKLVELAGSAGSPEICRTCGGECCLLGKYHVSMLDILAYLKSGFEPVVPNFSAGRFCPYSNSCGCLMQPCFRPVTCVIFNCQPIEDRLTATGLETFYRYERQLRDRVARAGCIHGIRTDRSLLFVG